MFFTKLADIMAWLVVLCSVVGVILGGLSVDFIYFQKAFMWLLGGIALGVFADISRTLYNRLNE
jgi:hypothetical protein